MNQEIENKAVACTHCGSEELSWQTFNRNTSGVSEGRLCSREISCEFVLGCDDCSETLRVVSADVVAQMLGTMSAAYAAPAPVDGDGVAKAVEQINFVRNNLLSSRVINGTFLVDDSTCCRWVNALLIALARLDDALAQDRAKDQA